MTAFPANFFNKLIAVQFVIANNGALLVYTPSVAAGHLFITIAAAAGTDQFGDSFPQGITIFDGSEQIIGNWSLNGLSVYNDPGPGLIQIVTDPTAQHSPRINISGHPSLFSLLGFLSADSVTVGSETDEGLVLSGPIAATDTNNSRTYITLSSISGGGADSSGGSITYINTSEGPVSLALWNKNVGFQILGTATAVHPGADAYTSESWQTPASFLNGWTGSGFQYRMEADGTVQFTGVLDHNTTAPGSPSQIFTLPSGYMPVSTKYFIVPTLNNGDIALIQINNGTGAVFALNWQGVTMAANTAIAANAIRYSTTA